MFDNFFNFMQKFLETPRKALEFNKNLANTPYTGNKNINNTRQHMKKSTILQEKLYTKN